MGRKPLLDATLYNYKHESTIAAKELGYPKEVVKAIEAAKTESEISRIMHTARERFIKDAGEMTHILSGHFTDEENQYIKEHCFDNYKIVAEKIKRNPESVRCKMYKYRTGKIQ